MSVALIIPSGGVGNRFSATVKKQFYEIYGKPIIYLTVKKMLSSYDFDEVVFGVADDDIEYIKTIVAKLNIKCKVTFSKSGAERANTVYNALLKSSSDYVAIHDAVRPYVSEDTVKECIAEAIKSGGAICGVFARDSIKIVEDNIVKTSIDRCKVFLAYTPQVFLRDRLIKSYDALFANGGMVTDDAGAYELAGYTVSAVVSNKENIKITYLEDVEISRGQ